MLAEMSPSSRQYRVTFACDERCARSSVDLIVETFEPGEAAASAFEVEASASPCNAHLWQVEAYFGQEPDLEALRLLVAITAGDKVAALIVVSEVLESEWIVRSTQGLYNVNAGRFQIRSSPHQDSPKSSRIAIEIAAALAFGTGHHGTTRGCLLLMDRVGKRTRPAKMLDVGCGSGILAIAGAKLWRIKIAAGDVDPIAVEAALQNARNNGVRNFVAPVVSVGAQHLALRSGGPYDLVCANILARPLRLLAGQLSPLIKRTGQIILSGLLVNEVPGILTAWRGAGFSLVDRIDLQGWSSLLLRRGGATPPSFETITNRASSYRRHR